MGQKTFSQQNDLGHKVGFTMPIHTMKKQSWSMTPAPNPRLNRYTTVMNNEGQWGPGGGKMV